MLCFPLGLLGLTCGVQISQGYLLGLYQSKVEEHIDLCDRLCESAALIQPHEFDRVSAFMASVAVPAGFVNLERCCLLSVKGAADVAASVGLESVVLNDLPGGDALLDDWGRFHDGHTDSPSLRGSVRISMILSPVSSLWQKWNSVPYLVDIVWMALYRVSGLTLLMASPAL